MPYRKQLHSPISPSKLSANKNLLKFNCPFVLRLCLYEQLGIRHKQTTSDITPAEGSTKFSFSNWKLLPSMRVLKSQLQLQTKYLREGGNENVKQLQTLDHIYCCWCCRWCCCCCCCFTNKSLLENTCKTGATKRLKRLRERESITKQQQ